MRVRVEGDSGHFVSPLERCAIQGLDVGENLIDLQAVRLYGAARQAVEHERIVGIWTVRYGDFHFHLHIIVVRGQIRLRGATDDDREAEEDEHG